MLGRFNPLILQPQWLGRFKILPAQDIQWAEGQQPEIEEVQTKSNEKIVFKRVPKILVTNQASELNFPDIRIVTLEDRFECSTQTRECFSKVVETTIKIFQFLKHTPIVAVGINFDAHHRYAKEPEEILSDIFRGNSKLLTDVFGDNISLSGKINDQKDGYKFSVKLEKSKRLKSGVYISINYHRDLETGEAEEAIEWINNKFKDLVSSSTNTILGLFGQSEEIWTPES